MAVAERTLADHDRELENVRKRLHLVEAHGPAIGHLTDTVKALVDSMEGLARRVATEAVTLALQDRQDRDDRAEGRTLQWTAILVAITGTLASIYFNARGG